MRIQWACRDDREERKSDTAVEVSCSEGGGQCGVGNVNYEHKRDKKTHESSHALGGCGARGHVVIRELSIDIRYKGACVAAQRMDMVIDDTIIVENKAAEKLCPADRMQLINYLRATKFQVGLLFHFGPAPRFERYLDHPKKELPTSIGSPTRA